MNDAAFQNPRTFEAVEARAAIDEPGPARIPHVSIHAFHESDEFAGLWGLVAQDRRMVSARTDLRHGGFPAALSRYAAERSPDLIVIETRAGADTLEYQVDSLADVCHADTRLIIVGHLNEIGVYRKLLDMGVSNYLVAPVGVATLISAISELYREPGREKIGRITAVIGAKGGVGSSTLAQAAALELSERRRSDVLLVDLDLAFGTASLNLDVDPTQGIAELVERDERIEPEMLDRVVVRRGEHLCLLGMPPGLDGRREIDEDAIERIVEVAQTHVRHTVLDLPHLWAPWIERAVMAADQLVIVTTPEISSLRNTVALIGRAKALRPNDPPPLLVLNQVGMPRRQEVSARDIAQVLKLEPSLSIPFDPRAFSMAAARGKVLTEVAGRRPIGRACASLAAMLAPEDAPPTRPGLLSRLISGPRRRVA